MQSPKHKCITMKYERWREIGIHHVTIPETAVILRHSYSVSLMVLQSTVTVCVKEN